MKRAKVQAASVRREFGDLGCVLALLSATLAYYAPALFFGRVLLPSDVVPVMRPWVATVNDRFPEESRFAQNQMLGPIFEYYSWRYYARERIRVGEIPLWNPYEMSGNVLLANSQSAVLYPPNLLLYALPLWVGINLVTALHMFLSGLFLFLLLRELGLSRPAAMTGALVWMFCGLQIAWTEFQTPTAVLCWLSALLWSWERGQNRNAPLFAALAGGGFTALALLAGHLHFAFYVFLAYFLFALFRRWPGPGWLPKATISPGALALGVLLSMATILPVLEMGRMNYRQSKPDYASAISLRLPPENLFTLFQPNLFGNPRDYLEYDNEGVPKDGHNYRGKFEFVEYACYVGVGALSLSLLGLFSVRRRSKTDKGPAGAGAFGLIGAVGLLLALGTPLCAVFFYLAPGYRQFNATGRALCLFCFALAALSAYGVEHLLGKTAPDSGQERQRAVRAFLICLAAVGVAGFIGYPGLAGLWKWPNDPHWQPYLSQGMRQFAGLLLLSAASVWLAIRSKPMAYAIPVICAADLYAAFGSFNPSPNPGMLGYPTQVTEFLKTTPPDRVLSMETPGSGIKSLIVPNFNAVVGYREVQGADSLHTWRYHHLMERVARALSPSGSGFMDPNTVRMPAPRHPVLDMLNLRYVTTEPQVTIAEQGFLHLSDYELTVWENPRASGAAWFPSRQIQAEGVDAAFAAMNQVSFDPKRDTVLEAGSASLGAGEATLTAFSPQRLVYTVRASSSGLLVMSEPYFPGWRATVNGRRAQIRVANYILRSVEVPQGEHRLEFRYEPASYRTGLFATCLAAGLCAALLACRSRRVRPE